MESIAIIGARGIPKNFVGTSGIESYVEQQLPQLVKTNRVCCYIHKWAATEGIHTYFGAKIISIPTVNTTYFDTFIYSFFSSFHATFAPSTIIWYHGVGPAFFAFIPKLFHKRVYTTIHTRDWERKKWSFIGKIFLKLCEQIALICSTKVFVVSENLQHYYHQQGKKGIILKKYHVTSRKQLRSTTVLKKYNLKKDAYILFVGRFVPEKRIDWIINAANSISMPIVLVGGSSHTDNYVTYLQKLSQRRNIIFTGYLFNQEKDAVISNCKVFVLPSQTEGLPISVIEALEFNKKCLIGDFLSEEFGRNRLIKYFKTDDYQDFLNNLQSCIRRTAS